MRPPALVWAGIAVVLGCSRGVTHPTTRTGDAHASGTPAPSSAPSASPPAEEVIADLGLVKELKCETASLHVLAGKTFASCGQELWVIEGDELKSEPGYQRGLVREEPSFVWWIESMAGDWPDAVWLGTNRSTEDAARGRIYGWAGGRWAKVADARWDEPFFGLLAWTGQSVLALVQPANTFGARFIPLGKHTFTPPSFTRPSLPYANCLTRIRVEAQTVLGPGDVMVAGGQVCDVVMTKGRKDGVYTGIGVERFRADRAQGELTLLTGLPPTPPNSRWEVTALEAVTPQSVLLAAQSSGEAGRILAFLARWDGTGFAPVPEPFPGGVNKLWVESPEVLWATDLEGRLWRGRAERWVSVRWPGLDAAGAEITRVWARGPDDVWIVTRQRDQPKSAIFHGRVASPERRER